MDDATREVVGLWLRKADNDLLNIRNNLAADDVPTDMICFTRSRRLKSC